LIQFCRCVTQSKSSPQISNEHRKRAERFHAEQATEQSAIYSRILHQDWEEMQVRKTTR
jgi:hypothetical protein